MNKNKIKFYHHVILPFYFSAFCLCGFGCATVNPDVIINNFKQTQIYPPLVLTDDTKASLKSLVSKSNLCSTLNFGIGSDDVQPQIITDGIRQVLLKRFKQQGDETKNNLVMLFDAHVKLGMFSGTTTSLSLTGTFMDGDQTIDTIKAEGKAVMPYPAINFAFHKAALIAFAQFDENLRNSQILKAYVYSKALGDFQQQVNTWRALPKKPLPEEARRFRVLADDAVQNKEFDKAANFYEQGLAIEPMWLAGQYNAAMIYSELNSYAMAAMHMKRYLVLKPEDTKKYQDQIYIWEEKAKESNE
jgi:hypothetical protein